MVRSWALKPYLSSFELLFPRIFGAGKAIFTSKLILFCETKLPITLPKCLREVIMKRWHY